MRDVILHMSMSLDGFVAAAIAHPTSLRLKQSMTVARYKFLALPSMPGIANGGYVMSPTYTRFGAGAVKFRYSRSGYF